MNGSTHAYSLAYRTRGSSKTCAQNQPANLRMCDFSKLSPEYGVSIMMYRRDTNWAIRWGSVEAGIEPAHIHHVAHSMRYQLRQRLLQHDQESSIKQHQEWHVRHRVREAVSCFLHTARAIPASCNSYHCTMQELSR